MGGHKLFWSSLGIVLITSTYVMACDDKGFCLLEALKELKECKKSVLAALLKPLLTPKLLDKKEPCGKCGELALPLPPPPTIMLVPAGAPAPPPLPPPCPLLLPAPCAPPPQFLFPAPPPPPMCFAAPPPPMYLPAPAPPPIYLPPPPAPMMLPPPAPRPAPLFLPAPPPCAYPPPAPLYLPPAAPPAPAPIIISLLPPAPPPCACPPPPRYAAPPPYSPPPCAPPSVPMNAYLVAPPVPCTLEPKPLPPKKSCSCTAPPCPYYYPYPVWKEYFGIDVRKPAYYKLVKPEHFASWYKWMIIGDELPDVLHQVRYDADMVLVKSQPNSSSVEQTPPSEIIHFFDIYVHPSKGASLHPWACWSNTTGLQLTQERDRILRRKDLQGYPMKIAVPVGHYSQEWYKGTFTKYLLDEKMREQDSTVRCSYGGSSLLVEALNGTEVLVETQSWNAVNDNRSALTLVATGSAQLTGAILRMLLDRIKILDYVFPIWPFSVGFTYLAERESSSNMYVEPFSPGVWWCCLGIGLILALTQRITARRPEEKEGALIGVLATWLQQDASAVPEGASGRWSFIVLSVCAMLVHAYYTSAIVSALMSSGRSGPDSLRALGDSKYAIASDGLDYMRNLFFDVKTNWEDLEYLKRKKKTSKFYQNIERGVKLISEGNTAYHTDYNEIFPYFKTFSDDHVCKLQYVDTIPEVLTWITATKSGQWTEVLRSSGAWLHETGQAKRLVSRFKFRPPPCRSSLLAERVKFGDVAPLLALTALGAVVSLFTLVLEVVLHKFKGMRVSDVGSEVALNPQEDMEYIVE